MLKILTASTSNLVSMLLILLYSLCDLINLCFQHFSMLYVNMSLAVTRNWDMTSTTSHLSPLWTSIAFNVDLHSFGSHDLLLEVQVLFWLSLA